MRQIKFRGIDIVNGKWVYGHYNPFGNIPIIEVAEGGVEIHPDSLAQLVGHDKNGKEIYEGDLCLDEDGKEFKAVFEPDFFANSTLKT